MCGTDLARHVLVSCASAHRVAGDLWVGPLSTHRQDSVGDVIESAGLLFGQCANMVPRCVPAVNVGLTDMRLVLRVLPTPLALHGWPSRGYYILVGAERPWSPSVYHPSAIYMHVRQCAIYTPDPPSPLSAFGLSAHPTRKERRAY